ncbi:MAG: bifunctional UDP-3-O-[3-hydroxymyristoyl] N-acetylglucosamine deacetylase/3-hydroxyacyl-ACP dehydratase [Candidatus Marinimicrobia bacterium]|nr:bifunctional UDP-3-O-[3-hydroxymyristoyl] N-acetylglucosamine deacetylase/3-hydroxyacyl-ACP dehydratase [Candidatus Neomarinimicrobiota bacterium]MBL7023386.1 bifunctional UDP-3-O-[3-hydroxymyristoyl] N-acetylglucosamine deacetylase/3-hydroxyacyl-ACP dehydratase [Candidatus Neomarinimicrobiota bacterium]MBL7109733.1 bifunctional UDP-3-O-[3-hydroxymyristoyl] N-acetylglucosamine deacetylase/3-hydroxyacyl-ACP dehydratase [Candidatus Neomarinimicrobiota bacterium]
MSEENYQHSKYQKTIRKSVELSGIGLHTGVESTAIFQPAPPNTGIRFKRLDLEDCPEILADIDHVIDISRGTSIGQNGNRIHTVEHILAAVTGLQIDNILIELTNKEPPVMDGSAKPFVDVLLEAGIEEQSAYREELVIDRTISYSDPERGVDIYVLPSKRFSITFMTDYNFSSLGTQYMALYSLGNDFVERIAPSRTYCFFSEIKELKEQGLIMGGGIDNAVVFLDRKVRKDELEIVADMFNAGQEIFAGDNGIMNGVKLRFQNEPVRHKILDLIGDLALLGMPIRGHIIAAKSGHAANIELVKNIKKAYSNKIIAKRKQQEATNLKFDIQAILKVMPHRYPFLLIDRILDVEPGKVVHALKNVTINEPYFQGHFPEQPVMPGVMILETMAQAGGFLILNSIPNPETKLMYFTAINKSKFRKVVVPGDQIHFEVSLLKFKLNTCKIAGKAIVDGKVVAESEMMASVVDRSS